MVFTVVSTCDVGGNYSDVAADCVHHKKVQLLLGKSSLYFLLKQQEDISNPHLLPV